MGEKIQTNPEDYESEDALLSRIRRGEIEIAKLKELIENMRASGKSDEEIKLFEIELSKLEK